MSRIAKAAVLGAAASAVLVGGAGVAAADAGAQGAATNSPGVVSGNVIQVPVHVPVNICGNTVDVVGILNPTFGNVCINGDEDDRGNHHDDRHDDHHNGKDDHHNGKDDHENGYGH